MVTNQQADEAYQNAKSALNDIISSPDTTEEQRRICQEKRTDLTLAFIGQVIDRIEERTAKFLEFIGEMEAVIAEFDPRTTIAGIIQLREVVDKAAVLVEAATAAVPATRSGVSARRAADATPERRAPAPAQAKRPAKRPKRPKRRASPKSSRPGSAAKGKGKAAKRASAPRKPKRSAAGTKQRAAKARRAR
jgi:hypothetical protein